MPNIRIVTDSTADLPLETRTALGIEMVPLKVLIGQETYLDSVTLNPQQFYEKLIAAPSLPTTSQPSPIEFLETYQKLLQTPDTEIISVHISSQLSGTCQSARIATLMLSNNKAVSVFDSLSASSGLGLIVLAGAEAAKQGKSRDECVAIMKRTHENMKLYFVVDTLEYLQKGGRIGKASAVLGALLDIKPILTIDEDGIVNAVERVRGRKKALNRIVELLLRDYKNVPVRVTLAHANNLPTVEALEALLKDQFDIRESMYTSIGPAIGAHAGPGAVGIFMSRAD